MYSSLRNSHYRLSIIYSKLEDSDTYTCVSQVDTVCNITVDIIYNVWSQHGLATSLTVEVTQLQCPPLASLTRYCDLYPLYTDLTTDSPAPGRTPRPRRWARRCTWTVPPGPSSPGTATSCAGTTVSRHRIV